MFDGRGAVEVRSFYSGKTVIKASTADKSIAPAYITVETVKNEEHDDGCEPSGFMETEKLIEHKILPVKSYSKIDVAYNRQARADSSAVNHLPVNAIDGAEDNILHDSRCSAVSLGKNATLGDNLAANGKRKSGYQYQIENVFKAKEFGWTKDKIGSHVVRNNTIYDCGQTGIVGHMGCAFSEIYGNHIYNIGNKEEFFGYEIAGIKFHAAIDVQIHDNYIHNCGGCAGIWLDWQTQGTRVSRNLLRNNEKALEGDFFIEVSHGPYMADNNIFASKYNVMSVSQGGAYIHNLFFGASNRFGCLPRSTPYHGNHTTEVAGFVCVYGEDDRWYQNIFAGESEEKDGWKLGTSQYNGCPASMEEYLKEEHKGEGSDETGRQPAYINGNCYFNGAEAFNKEKDNYIAGGSINPRLLDEDGKVYLEIEVPREIQKVNTTIIGTDNLESPRISEQPYENPDGTPIAIDTDLTGEKRSSNPTPGPIENLKEGYQKILIWRGK